jgi:hypothetical protein
MRKLMMSMALLMLIGGAAAIAQTGAQTQRAPQLPTQNPSVGPPLEAPIGHRQPRVDQVPSEQNLGGPNAATSKEDVALDRKIKSICRGC